MSLIFLDSFDDGLTTSKWTNLSNITVDTVARNVRAMNLTDRGATADLQLSNTAKHATLIVGFAFRGNTPSGAATRRQLTILGDSGTTTHLSFVYRDVNGKVLVYNGAGTLIASSVPNAVPVDTYVYLETKVVLSDTVGVVTVKVNGAIVVNFSGDTKNGGTDPTFDHLVFGFGSNFDSTNYHMDDLYILNGAGAVNNNFIGDCNVYARFPDGNGNYSQGVNSGGTSVNNYTYVDENPDPNTSDYVAFATTGDKDTYTFGNIPAGTVYGVQQAAYAAKSDAGTRTLRNIQRIAGADYASSNDQGLSITPTYAGKFDIIENSPATGVAWTVTEVNAAEFGTEARP